MHSIVKFLIKNPEGNNSRTGKIRGEKQRLVLGSVDSGLRRNDELVGKNTKPFFV